ncbi:MAG: PucR family transcriptional regulator [Acidimicrobiia bacterium]
MELTVADLLQLPVLRPAQVITKGSFDPYRSVGGQCISAEGPAGVAGLNIFCAADPGAISATVSEPDGWPAVCVVSPRERPPADDLFTSAIDQAAERGAIVLWLRTRKTLAELEQRFYRELLAYHQAEADASRRIQRRLNEILVAGGSLEEVCRELALVVQNPVSIKTAYHEVVAYYDVGKPDTTRRRTNQAGHIPPDILEALTAAGLPDRLQREVGAFRFGPLPEIDYHSRVMAPIRTESALWGYISIAETADRLGLLYLSAVEAAANCAALIVWKQRALEQRAREQQTQYIGDVLFADQDEETLSVRAPFLGYDPSERYTAVVFEMAEPANPPTGTSVAVAPAPEGRLRELARTVDDYLALHGARRLVFSICVGHRVVCLWPSAAGDAMVGAETILRRVGEGFGGGQLRAAVGGTPGPGETPAVAYRRALLARRLTPSDVAVATYRGLGLARLVVENLDETEVDRFADEFLGALEEYDAGHGRELVHTLEAYYRCGRNFVATAEALFVHLNTVRYRLRRCSELTGLDVDDPETALNVQVALLIRRMQHLTAGR